MSDEDKSPARPPWFAEVQEIYADLDREVEPHQHLCRLRSVCCDFRSQDHVLYATSLEIEFARVSREIPIAADDALCPFWRRGLCGARAERPLGCRTYFCDPSWRDRGEDLHERYHQRLQDLARRHGVGYHYRPWVEALAEIGRGERRSRDDRA